MIKIVIDTKGADKGVEPLIKGVSSALEKFSEVSYLLVGDEEYIKQLCAEYGISQERVEILDAPEEITNYDNPAEALFKKTDSSMLMGLQTLASRDDIFGMISAGNTGVLLTGAMRYVSRKERIRPALAAVLPSSNGGFTCLVDTGATIDCTPQMLHHFAKLGADFMKATYGIDDPKIGLLSNGSESSKGNKLVKETYPLLAEDESLNFVGNVEGSTALSGVCDVLVCDGFAGNQVLKVTEGTATRIITDLVKFSKATGDAGIMKAVAHLMGIYDFASLGGGIILGVDKPVIKAHGASDERAIVSTAGILMKLAANEEIFDKSAFDIKET
jgi:glycerol-3-phosphate acyltransferase PlsX